MIWNSGKRVKVKKIVNCSAKGIFSEVGNLLISHFIFHLFTCISEMVRSAWGDRFAKGIFYLLGGSGSYLRWKGVCPLVVLNGSALLVIIKLIRRC